MDYLASILIIGLGATAVMDLWGFIRKQVLGIAAPDYRLVGRWIGYMGHGRFRHESIKASPSIAREGQIGWIAHYLIGIGFAAALIGIWGLEWVKQPTLGPALAVGIGTVAAPFLLMQPGMGAGIAASRTPRPNAARIQSLITHGVFGLGLYIASWLTKLMDWA
jgi:hypothetical protein